VNLLESRASREIQDSLREEPVLQGWRKDDAVPEAVEILVGEGTNVVDSLLVGRMASGARGNGSDAIHVVCPTLSGISPR
jgi:hypothetical protein